MREVSGEIVREVLTDGEAEEAERDGEGGSGESVREVVRGECAGGTDRWRVPQVVQSVMCEGGSGESVREVLTDGEAEEAERDGEGGSGESVREVVGRVCGR